MAYTLATAAEAAKVSKPTVFKWIKKGKISATKTDDGTYRIDPAELHRYLDSVAKEKAPQEPTQQAATEAVSPIDTLPEAIALRYEVEKLKALLETERQRVEEWKAVADRWAQQAERLALPGAQQPRIGLIARLLRRAG